MRLNWRYAFLLAALAALSLLATLVGVGFPWLVLAGALVLLVHHSGKDASKGARGHALGAFDQTFGLALAGGVLHVRK